MAKTSTIKAKNAELIQQSRLVVAVLTRKFAEYKEQAGVGSLDLETVLPPQKSQKSQKSQSKTRGMLKRSQIGKVEKIIAKPLRIITQKNPSFQSKNNLRSTSRTSRTSCIREWCKCAGFGWSLVPCRPRRRDIIEDLREDPVLVH